MIQEILDFNTTNGLVFCSDLESAENNSEIIYISEIKNLNAEAVYFRRFFRGNESKPYHSEPAVCIFKEEVVPFKSEEHLKLHASLWSAGRNEIYVIYGRTRINIINARKPSAVNEDKKPFINEELILVSSAINEFEKELYSARLFGIGTFWEQTEFQDKLNEGNSPYFYLLTYLMSVRKNFLKTDNFKNHPAIVDKLLITSLLIKFLEEKGEDEVGKHTLQDIYNKLNINSYVEAVQQNKCVKVFEELSNEFNGKIFDKFTVEEKGKIENSDLAELVYFLKPDTDIYTKQMFLWDLYDFKYLPTEIISAIYENFIQAEELRTNNIEDKGVVYTPIHLVNFLIDEVMPLSDAEKFKNESFKILDPSCGSGVFLVAAYKRLLQWWAINNSTKNSITYPDSKKAKKILEDNIYGVDTKEMATLVTVLSLTTALVDKLSPKEIWNNLKFKDLTEKNIKKNNFFEWAALAKTNEEVFDLVLGNPPFNIENGVNKKDVLEQSLLKKIHFKHTIIPKSNLALHFFEGSMALSKKVCMIIPSNVLLYSKSEVAQKYREGLFSDFTVTRIFDFTHLRRILFHKSADTPVTAIIAESKPSEQESIQHVVIKRTISTELGNRFEIDDYDCHTVRWNWAIDETKQFVWKTNLLGGGRLFHLVYRLSLLRTINDYIDSKKKENSEWLYSSGYKVGGGNTKKYKAPFLHLKRTLDTKTRFDNVNHSFHTTTETASEFEAPRNEILYNAPLLIIAEYFTDNEIPMQLVNHYQPFNISFIGIHAPLADKESLNNIYTELYSDKKKSKLRIAYMLATSAKLLINKETAFVKEDFDQLPYPEESKYLDLSNNEETLVDDVLNYYRHLGKSIGPKQDGYIFHEEVSKLKLEEFCQTFCDTLNEIYAKNNKSWQIGQIYQTPNYIITQFGFGADNGLISGYLNELDINIKNLVDNELNNKGAIYKRVVRFYKHIDGFDSVFFVKPKSLRYWFKSIALRDADDTYFELKNSGY